MILNENGEIWAPYSFEVPVNFCRTALRRISEYGTLHIHRSENLNLNKNILYLQAGRVIFVA